MQKWFSNYGTIFTSSFSCFALGKCSWQDTPNKIQFPFIIYIQALINYKWQLISGVQGPSLSAVSESAKCTVRHGLWTLTKNLSTLYRFRCLFAEETSLIICESARGVRERLLPRLRRRVYAGAAAVRAFDNNKESENEEELNCVSHFSFPCFGACQKKALHFEWWLRQQKVNNKPCGSEEGESEGEREKVGKKEKSVKSAFFKMTKPRNKTKKIPMSIPW